MTVIIKRIGGSMAVVIPKAVAREMELSEGLAVDITTSDGVLLMKKRGRRSRRSLEDIVVQIEPEHYRRRSGELTDGGTVGKEVW